MSQGGTLLVDLTVKELFVPLISSAGRDLQFELSPVSETYLVSLLESALFTATVFAKNVETGLYDEPMLSERFLKALQETQKSKKYAELKKLGDSILFKTGFFAESFNRKLSGLNFQMQMGSSAYGNLYSDSKNPVYEDLADRFAGYVDLISHIGRKINLQNQQDILHLFDRCVGAGSKGAESKLIGLGLNPIDIKKASNQ